MIIEQRQLLSSRFRVEANARVALWPRNVTDWFVLLIPLSQFVEVHLIGDLYVPDIILTLLFPFLVVRFSRKPVTWLPATFLVLGILWFLGQVVTDIARGSAFENYSRGWANIIFALVEFFSLYFLVAGKPRRIVLFAIGLAFGGIAAYFINPNVYAQTYPWKFGYGFPITLLLVLWATILNSRRKHEKFLPVALLFIAGTLNIYMGYRDLGGTCFLAVVYVLLQAFLGRTDVMGVKVRARHIVLFGVVGLIATVGILAAYEYAAGTGLLGASSLTKYKAQANGEYGLLLGGRSELLVSARAIIDSPIIGYGSWAKDCHYAYLLTTLRRRLGYAPEGSSESCLIPSHSHLFGQWISAGVFGAIFWIWVFALVLLLLIKLYRTRESLTPMIAFIAFNLMWDILFSPFSGEQRLIDAYAIVVITMYLSVYSSPNAQLRYATLSSRGK